MISEKNEMIARELLRMAEKWNASEWPQSFETRTQDILEKYYPAWSNEIGNKLRDTQIQRDLAEGECERLKIELHNSKNSEFMNKMNHALIQVHGNGSYWHLDENPICSEYTLCGVAPEGVEDTANEPKEKIALLRDITCPQCLSLIKFCKQLK